MNSNHINFVVMGVVAFFVVIFFAYSEINRSQALIDVAEDPIKSLERGFVDAESDFSEGHAHFQRYNGEYPGVTEYEFDNTFKEHSRIRRYFCVFGWYLDDLGLRISSYEYNEIYVTAYNTRLKTLASK